MTKGFSSLTRKTKNLIVAGGLSGFVIGVYYYTMRAVGGTDELQIFREGFFVRIRFWWLTMSQADVVYSCSSCGYPLNLSSSNQVTSGIRSNCQKSSKKGVISFVSVDLSRFTQVDEKLQNRADCNAFGLTCHRWLQIQNIARRSLALHFSYDPNIYRNYVIYLPRLLTRFPHLSSISLAGCTELPDSALLRMPPFGIYYSLPLAIRGTGFAGCSSTLTYLEADSCMLTPEGVSEAVSGGGLEYLNISNLRICVGADGLAMIGAGSATKLRYLNLRMCRFVSDDSVIAIAQGCPLLEEWSLSVCHELHGIGDIQDAEARCADKKRGMCFGWASHQ
ncbi:hypothetical protein OPV22_013692 [Ensete ventricosum]|uniref:Cytochrome c oxidase assembly factor 3 mitochondrial coiled-coil domain-containing protein n=1 Tax=Ensete ventricosum TaxID=4639 RepID=A0AAV8RA84_ENSVE|nr:hypothetical protein OPV22_013692 [Ensete ventricosum]